MGLFDKFKKALGGSEAEKDVTVAPSQLLRQAGIDPSGLKFGFGTGTIAVSGTIASEADRDIILEVLAGIDSIDKVEDHMIVAKPAPAPAPEPGPQPEPTPEPQATAEGDRTYTVVSGDSLWKIAEAMYGNGSKYTKIFEANRDILDDPDQIFPGQELKIPDLED